MLSKIVKDAGFEVISNEDRACLLVTVENLQLQRDKYRDLFLDQLNRAAGAEEHF